MLNRKPTPISKKPHIRMNVRRKKVLALERPPCRRYFWKTLENQRAAVTAKSELPTEAADITITAKREPVRRAVEIIWLKTDPATMKSTDLINDSNVISEKSFCVMGRVESSIEDSALTNDVRV